MEVVGPFEFASLQAPKGDMKCHEFPPLRPNWRVVERTHPLKGLRALGFAVIHQPNPTMVCVGGMLKRTPILR